MLPFAAGNYKGLLPGELVYYKLNHKSGFTIDQTKTGIVIEVYAPGRNGFSFAQVLWSDTEEIDTIAVNYLYRLDKN
ncbi:MAG TPA: hypothetical protein EYQ00_09510 [Dehalococcoidia bacterium]|nr:hypothetical protein [Dehalococcoidia bacterium]